MWIKAVTMVYLITFACYGCRLHGAITYVVEEQGEPMAVFQAADA